MQNNHSVSRRLMYCWEFLCSCGSTSMAVHTLSYRYRNNVSYSHHPILHRPPASDPLSACQICHHESPCRCSKHPLMMKKKKQGESFEGRQAVIKELRLSAGISQGHIQSSDLEASSSVSPPWAAWPPNTSLIKR